MAYINALPKITGSDEGGPAIPTVAPLCPTPTPDSEQPACVTLPQGQRVFAISRMQAVTLGASSVRKLVGRHIISTIFAICSETAEGYFAPGDYLHGASIAGLLRVSRAMTALGVI